MSITINVKKRNLINNTKLFEKFIKTAIVDEIDKFLLEQDGYSNVAGDEVYRFKSADDLSVGDTDVTGPGRALQRDQNSSDVNFEEIRNQFDQLDDEGRFDWLFNVVSKVWDSVETLSTDL